MLEQSHPASKRLQTRDLGAATEKIHTLAPINSAHKDTTVPLSSMQRGSIVLRPPPQQLKLITEVAHAYSCHPVPLMEFGGRIY